MERSPEVRAEPAENPQNLQIAEPQEDVPRWDGPSEVEATEAMRRSYRQTGEQPPLYYE